MNIMVVYDTKLGNTKQVALAIVEGMKEIEGVEVHINHVNEIDLKHVSEYDAFLVGSPNRAGGPTGSIKKLIKKLGNNELKIAVFDTYTGKDFEKTVKKLEKLINKMASGLEIVSPGLSVQIEDMKGPLVDGELSKCNEFGCSVGEKLLD